LNTAGYSKAAKVWFDSTISILKGNGSTQPTAQPTQPGGWTQPTSPVSTTDTIKIMPVGDSCTEGMGDPDMGSYRTELYRLYKNAGLNFDFVGSNKRGPSSLPDKDNEGHSGWTIPQVASNIDNWLNTQNPDVVLLWIGGNDIFQTGKINTTGLSNLIDQILRKKPNVKIFVADYYPNPDMVTQYNATIPGVVQEKANAGKAVYFVKLSGMGYVKSADTSSDGLHLNTAGYIKAAKVWYDSTISILKGSTNTPVPPTQTIAPVLKGDVDGDGSVTSLDFGHMRKYILGMISSFPSANGLKAADVNGDGEVNSLDFAGLRLILLGSAK
jgi:lysophospholipase L1-like esterase